MKEERFSVKPLSRKGKGKRYSNIFDELELSVKTISESMILHCQERRNDERKGETELSVNPQESFFN